MSILDEMRKEISQNIGTISSAIPRSNTADTEEQALEKVINGLVNAKETLASGNELSKKSVVKWLPQNNAYYVGVKYGSRWLNGEALFGKGEKHIGPFETERETIEAIDFLIAKAKAGEITQLIAAIRK